MNINVLSLNSMSEGGSDASSSLAEMIQQSKTSRVIDVRSPESTDPVHEMSGVRLLL